MHRREIFSTPYPRKNNQAFRRPISRFIQHHYRHFNAASLVDAAKGYVAHLDKGGKMMITLGGAKSTAELGLSLAEMIRRDKVYLITCTGANLEEDVFNLVAHDYYERVPNYRELTPRDEQDLLNRHLNRVTDTCIPEGEVMRRMAPLFPASGLATISFNGPHLKSKFLAFHS